MVEEAQKSRIRLGLNADGDQVLMLGSEREAMSEAEVDNLINMLNTGKADSKDIKMALKKIKGIQKQYNTVGKPLANHLKVVEEDAEIPGEVVNAD
uniref:Uncharacterized protein n=1 Tax=viral metagenome TaxID=1070528 RepID=A0A6H1ZCX7_9ZZZZ